VARTSLPSVRARVADDFDGFRPVRPTEAGLKVCADEGMKVDVEGPTELEDNSLFERIIMDVAAAFGERLLLPVL
jgi:hypothetical protein